MGLVVVTPPASEPVTVDEAKKHLNVDHYDDDDLILKIIKAARIRVEGQSNKSYVPRTYRLDLHCFPYEGGTIRLTNGPVLSVESVTYIDTDDTVTTVDEADYIVDQTGEVATISNIVGGTWPVTYSRPGAVSVTYVAGYGTAPADPETDWTADVPDDAKVTLLMAISHLYDNRSNDVEMPPALGWMLDGQWIPQLA